MTASVSSRMVSAAIMLAVSVWQPTPASAAPQTVDAVTVTRQFDLAVKQFKSPEHEDSARAFKQIIDSLQPGAADLANDVRLILARSYAYHAEVMFDVRRVGEAQEDIRLLLYANPDFEADTAIASADFVRMLSDSRRATVGTLILDVRPSDAAILLDGRPAQNFQQLRLARGPHVIALSRPGYLPREGSVVVDPGDVRTETVSMEAVPVKVKEGRLSIRVQPADASVWIDGQLVVGSLDSRPLPAGLHVLRATRPGYQSAAQSVEIKDGKATTMDIRLTAVVAAQPVKAPAMPSIQRRSFPAPRVLSVRATGLYHYLPSFEASSPTTATGQVNSKYAAYTESRALSGYEVGATLRLGELLTIGASRSRATSQALADVSAIYPTSTGSSYFTGQTLMARTDEATHLDIGITVGDEATEFMLFAGPSWLKTTQDVAVGSTATAVKVRTLNPSATIGVHAGLDLSWYYKKYLGVGLTFSYSWAKASISPSVAGISTLALGGAQLGVGARLRF